MVGEVQLEKKNNLISVTAGLSVLMLLFHFTIVYVCTCVYVFYVVCYGIIKMLWKKNGFSSSSSRFTVSIIISDTLTSIIQAFLVTYQEAGTFDQAGAFPAFPQALWRGEGPLT